MKKIVLLITILVLVIFPFSVFALEDENNDNNKEIVEEKEEQQEEIVEEIESQIEVKSAPKLEQEEVIETTSILYRTHIQDIGWEKDFAKDGTASGTSHQSKRLEAIEIKIETNLSGGVEYRTHIQDIGWESELKKDGEMSGTSHQSKRLEAIEIKLYGELEENYDVYYRVHAQNIGWMNWAKNGEQAGTSGYSFRLEAIEIVLVEKGQSPPEVDKNVEYSYRKKQIQYQTHIESIGWQEMKYDGDLSGTTGKSKRLEAINISLGKYDYTGDIEYRAHVEKYGWMSWKKNGEMAGTSGESKRMEAVQIKLTGDIANYYDIYYRVHAENFGWMSWAKNGEMAGSSKHSCRLEAIEIYILPKGENPPERKDIKTEAPYIEDSGWQIINGKKYYIYDDGTRAQFVSSINGRRYEFTANGELQHENVKLVIDVSAHNKVIDWDSLWNSREIDGVIVRISAGILNLDAQFDNNMKAIKRLNIPYGFYIYSYAENYDEGKAYAQFVKSNAGKYLDGATLGIYFDLEENGITSYLDTDAYNRIVEGFVEEIPSANIYTYTNYSDNKLNSPYLKNLTTWIANYAVTDCPGNYRGWQYTDKGRATGISTVVDFSIFYY